MPWTDIKVMDVKNNKYCTQNTCDCQSEFRSAGTPAKIVTLTIAFRQLRCGKVIFHTYTSTGEGFHVTITHDTLELTVQVSAPHPPDMGPQGPPPPHALWIWELG